MQEYVEYRYALDLAPRMIRTWQAMLTRGRGFHALTAGSDDGGNTLSRDDLAAHGTCTLMAAGTAVDHDAA